MTTVPITPDNAASVSSAVPLTPANAVTATSTYPVTPVPAPTPTPVATSSTATASVDNPGISDEQDFQAVAARESIQSDRERIEENAAAYTVIQPTTVPDRPGSSDPNIVAYALSSTNPVGQRIYSRSSLNGAAKYQRACASYASSDLAQIDFLSNGGPEKDRRGVDPDGDGFACAWDPTPFRLAAGG